MCIGIPVKVIESGELTAVCEGRNGREQVNMLLVGSQPEGTWLLNFLGSAREVLSETDATRINLALDGLAEIMAGREAIDLDTFFPDISSGSVKPQ